MKKVNISRRFPWRKSSTVAGKCGVIPLRLAEYAVRDSLPQWVGDVIEIHVFLTGQCDIRGKISMENVIGHELAENNFKKIFFGEITAGNKISSGIVFLQKTSQLVWTLRAEERYWRVVLFFESWRKVELSLLDSTYRFRRVLLMPRRKTPSDRNDGLLQRKYPRDCRNFLAFLGRMKGDHNEIMGKEAKNTRNVLYNCSCDLLLSIKCVYTKEKNIKEKNFYCEKSNEKSGFVVVSEKVSDACNSTKRDEEKNEFVNKDWSLFFGAFFLLKGKQSIWPVTLATCAIRSFRHVMSPSLSRVSTPTRRTFTGAKTKLSMQSEPFAFFSRLSGYFCSFWVYLSTCL